MTRSRTSSGHVSAQAVAVLGSVVASGLAVAGTERQRAPKARPAPAATEGPPDPIRVFIVAEVRLYRDGLAEVLSREDHISVIGAVGDFRANTELIGELGPDILLLDMAVADSLGAVRLLGEIVPSVVALAVADEERHVLACAEAGVSGYVTRDQSIEDVVAVVEAVARGEMICSPRMAATLLRHVSSLATSKAPEDPEARLTARELEIVALIEQGLSNKQIARRLSIELPTVKNHVHNILEKLHVDRRAEAAARVRSGRMGHLPRLEESLPEI